jgi:hypothetical protein
MIVILSWKVDGPRVGFVLIAQVGPLLYWWSVSTLAQRFSPVYLKIKAHVLTSSSPPVLILRNKIIPVNSSRAYAAH